MKTMCFGLVNIRKGVVAIGVLGLVASIIALMIQFVVLAKQKEIMQSEGDLSGNNLFSFIFIIGIVVSFFKLIADILVIYGAVNQTTKEVSVWLIINLCTLLYIFGTMVFIYALLVGHGSAVKHEDVCLIEMILFVVNVVYIYLWYQVYLFSRQLYLDGRTSLEGILHTNVHDNSINA